MVSLDGRSIDGVLESIGEIGHVTGQDSRAAELVSTRSYRECGTTTETEPLATLPEVSAHSILIA
jgi:hypothetical protein